MHFHEIYIAHKIQVWNYESWIFNRTDCFGWKTQKQINKLVFYNVLDHLWVWIGSCGIVCWIRWIRESVQKSERNVQYYWKISQKNVSLSPPSYMISLHCDVFSIEMYRSFKPDTEVTYEILSKVNTYFHTYLTESNWKFYGRG